MNDELLPCPFCGGRMQFRNALWPSEGDTDAIIHAEPTVCGLIDFSLGNFDKTVIAAWNRRTPPADVRQAATVAREGALREAIKICEIYDAGLRGAAKEVLQSASWKRLKRLLPQLGKVKP